MKQQTIYLQDKYFSSSSFFIIFFGIRHDMRLIQSKLTIHVLRHVSVKKNEDVIVF